MYLYASEHALMDYHAESLLAEATKDKEAKDETDTDITE